jgi:hypothetical protein
VCDPHFRSAQHRDVYWKKAFIVFFHGMRTFRGKITCAFWHNPDMAVSTNVCMPLTVEEVLTFIDDYLERAVTRLNRPKGGEIYVFKDEPLLTGGTG